MPSKWQRETQTLSLFKAEQNYVKEREREREGEKERHIKLRLYTVAKV